MRRGFRQDEKFLQVFQPFIQHVEVAFARGDKFRQFIQLRHAHRRLHVRQLEVIADVRVSIFMVIPIREFPKLPLEAFAAVSIDLANGAYRQPLESGARALLDAVGPDCDVVLLGSIASGKYVEVLQPIFGDRLVFPPAFVGRGDMSRGGLMLRCVLAGVELEYAPIAGAILITDGRVHDVPADASTLGFSAPVHALITGHKDEIDRRVVLTQTPRFGIVGQSQTIGFRVEDQGAKIGAASWP